MPVTAEAISDAIPDVEAKAPPLSDELAWQAVLLIASDPGASGKGPVPE